MRRPTLCLLFLLAGCGGAGAVALPVEEEVYLPPEDTTTYHERSLNRQAPLTIEHPRLPPRTEDRAGMAGFCHSAGAVSRRLSNGRVVIRERETCENVAPRTLWPGHTEPRPTFNEDLNPLQQIVRGLSGSPDVAEHEPVYRPAPRPRRARVRAAY